MCQRRQKSEMFWAEYGRLKFGGSVMPSSKCRSERDIGVAGEIVVELERVAVSAGKHLGAGVKFGQIKYAIHQGFGEEIGDQKLLRQSHPDQKERLAAILGAQHLTLRPLRPECGEARDGSSDRGGEEARGCQVRQVAVSWLGVAAIEVDGVGERLEAVEGERERQHPRHHGQVFDGCDEANIERDAERDVQAAKALALWNCGARGR